METDDSIYFYGHTTIFGYCSNFYTSHFVDDENNNFCCSEQYLMYSKAKTFEPTNTQLLNLILKQTNPAKIKALGKKVQNYVDEIWSNIRLNIMIKGLRLKFQQNPNIAYELKSTGNKILYEASKYDKIWGIGYSADEAIIVDKKFYGTNLLGQALMKIRNEL